MKLGMVSNLQCIILRCLGAYVTIKCQNKKETNLTIKLKKAFSLVMFQQLKVIKFFVFKLTKSYYVGM